MSKIVKYITITFERGIVENFKQSDLDNEGVFQSVLFMNNWNPNLESKSLVKRYIETYDTSIDNWTIQGNKTYSVGSMNMSQPIAYKMPFAVVQKDGVRFYAFCSRFTAGNPLGNKVIETEWFNALDDVSDVRFKGYLPIGELADYCRYGEALYFVNTVSYPNTEKVYPVYKFAYWDKTKIRANGNVWLNGVGNLEGLTFTQNYLPYGDLSCLKVFEPNRSLVNKFKVIFKDNSVPITDTRTLDECITFHVWEKLSEIGDSKIHNKLHAYVVTPELPDNKEIVDDVKNSWHYHKPRRYTESISSILHNSTDIDFAHPDQGTLTYEELYDDFDSNSRIVYNNSSNKIYNCLSPVLNNNMDYSNPEDRFYTLDKDFVQSNKLITFAIPNYISNKMPRNWFPDEKITFLITIVENNIETVLGQYTHNITRDGYYPSSVTNQDDSTYLMAQHCPIKIDYAEHELIKQTSISTKSWTFTNTDRGDWKLSGGQTSDATEGRHSWNGTVFQRLEYANYPWTHIKPKYLCFTVSIGHDCISDLLSHNISAIKVYVVQPDLTQKGLLKSITSQAIEPPTTLYSKPKDIQLTSSGEQDYSVYSLIKEFRIVGDGNKIESWQTYDKRFNVSNAWKDDSNNKCIWAVGTDENSFGTLNGIPALDKLPHETYTEITGVTMPFDASDPLTSLTPDFCVWDYPTDSPVLNLGFSGKVWKGTGAGLIVVSNGVVYIGKCLDEFGNIEPAVWRWCLIQNGKPAWDIFPEENQITFGQENHTAGIVYREQLVAFTKDEFFRMSVAQAYTAEQWEVLDSVQGHGTFSQKTVCVCPDGFVFCDSNGIWISDGRLPMSLTNNPERGLAITSLYQSLMIGNNYTFMAHNQSFVLPANSIINGYNNYAELLYDEINNELILSSPVVLNSLKTSLNLIYSFTFNNWRIESYLRNEKLSYSVNHRYLFAKPDLQTPLIEDGVLKFSKIDTQNSGNKDLIFTNDINTSLRSHELGDSVDDNILHSAFLAVEPISNAPAYDNVEPTFSIAYRSSINNTVDPINDMIKLNMDPVMEPSNPLSAYKQLQTPIDISYGDDNIVSNESIKLMLPLRSKFRRATFQYISKHTIKIKAIIVRIVSMKRK